MPDARPLRRPLALPKSLWIGSIACIPSAALAHEGHGHVDARLIAHYLAEPEHLVWLGAAGVFAYGIRALRKRSRQSTRR